MEDNVRANEEVQATAFAGGIKLWMGITDQRLEKIEYKVDAIKTQQDKWLGAIAMVTGGLSAIAVILSIWSILN